MESSDQSQEDLVQEDLASIQRGLDDIANARMRPAEESNAAFRSQYHEQLAQFKKELQPAIDEFDAGLGTEMDVYEIYERVKQQLADEGITD